MRVRREVRFNARFAAFCRHWDVCPRACAPYRARTKGKILIADLEVFEAIETP